MFKIRRLINGIVLSTITVLISLWITAAAFDKNSYYLAQLLPLFMAFYLLLAWIIFLSQDRASSLGPRYKPHVQVLGHLETRLAREPEDQPIPVDSILDSNSLERTVSESITEEIDPFWEDSLYTLLWSAGLLALLATILYWFFQIGSRYPF
ncbi:MAG: hypothetical protein Q8S19_07180 [Bacillota bacterium]|nr:hypothetical protein [Bacillota bacterium]